MLQRKKQKVLGILLVLLILMTLSFSTWNFTYASTNDELTNDSYLVSYNLQTQEITTRPYPTTNINSRSNISSTNSYIPENVMPQSRAITGGNDSRTIVSNTSVFPHSAISYLEFTYSDGTLAHGSAFMVHRNYAYTAGHCVLDEDHGFVSSIRVVPGKNGTTEPFGDTWVTSVEYDSGWANDFNHDEDWAFLTLSSNIGDTTGWHGIACSDDYTYFETDSVVLSVLGYPDPNVRLFRQYTGSGPVVRASGMHLIYNIDTEGGQSGGPVRQGDYTIGIHTNSTSINGTIYNECSNITRARFEGFLSKIN